jgi:hypothetical protein
MSVSITVSITVSISVSITVSNTVSITVSNTVYQIYAGMEIVFENVRFGSENILFSPFDQLRKLTYLFHVLILTISILYKLCILNSDLVHINFDIKSLLCDLMNTLFLINIKC